MAIWPFRRKSVRKRSRSGAGLPDVEKAPPRSKTASERPIQRRLSQKKQRVEPNKLQRRARTYSFSPDRHDSIHVEGIRRGADVEGHPVPGSGPQDRPPHRGPNERPEGEWDRVPTLHKKRNGHHLPRRKSSKRRREDHDREAEIRAMTSFMPMRPATDVWGAGRPMKKDSRRVATGPGFSRPWDNPSSDISLPIPESIHSSMSSDSEFASYKINRLDSLAPRPTLRYTVYPRWGPPSGSGPTRTSSQKRKLSDRQIPESTLRAHKRIDELADDLDASDLRELMERDMRRRERRRQRERERTERQLTRKAEMQKAAEAAAAGDGARPPPNLERGVMGRELVGLGLEPISAVVTSSKRRPSDTSPKEPEKLPEGVSAGQEESTAPRPLDKFHRIETAPLETPTATKFHEELGDEPVPELPKSPKLKGFLRAKKSRSKSSLDEQQSKSAVSPPPGKAEEHDTRRKSDAASKGRLSLSSLFKWGSRRRSSARPPSFSNTSREEMQAAQTLPAAPIASASAAPGEPGLSGNLSSGTPRRTRSRFREDLPEFPISPPDSRLQSPEAELALAAVSERNSGERSSPIPMRFDTPTSGHRSVDETMRRTPTSWHQSNLAPSPEPHSISLASIDSEASWLSGRLTGRRSAGLRSGHSGQHGRTASRDTATISTDDEMTIPEDEYLSRPTPPSGARHATADREIGKEIGDAPPSSDEDEPMDEKWGEVGGGHATVVHRDEHAEDMVKSREGLLNSYHEDEDSGADEVGDPDKGDGLQRATSINLGKGHARHISAGSAKLLELSPRTSPRVSTDSKRRSSGIAFL